MGYARFKGMRFICMALFAVPACIFAQANSAKADSPCDGISRTITARQRAVWTPAVTRYWHKVSEGRITEVDIDRSFRYGGWTILHTEVHVSEGGYDFYSGDPARTKPVTSFEGAATVDEGPEVEAEILKNAPGIPKKLVQCFAYYVTKVRSD